MAKALAVPIWDPLQYCGPEDLSRLDERFDVALRDVTRLVFWTGVSPELARRWAEKNGLPTLVLAMGPLYSDRKAGSVRCGKSARAWTKFMKAASGQFAKYACREGRQAIVLTKPPPDIYSKREGSNYRNLEEPILKGGMGGTGTTQIQLVHPTVEDGATLAYQIWPCDQSSLWPALLTYVAKGRLIGDESFNNIEQRSGVTNQSHDVTPSRKKKIKVGKVQQKLEIAPKKGRKRPKNKRKQVQLTRGVEEKEAKRRQVELRQQQIARYKEAIKQIQRELERVVVGVKQDLKRKRIELEQQIAREQKQVPQKAVEQPQLRKKEIKWRRVELEVWCAQEKKRLKEKRVEMEQRLRDKKRHLRRKQTLLK